MRLLHARPDHVGGCVRRWRTCPQRRRDPRIYERQSLPLRRLSQHRRRHPRGQDATSELIGMRPFAYERASSPEAALEAFDGERATAFLAGGTTLIDLMKLDVM